MHLLSVHAVALWLCALSVATAQSSDDSAFTDSNSIYMLALGDWGKLSKSNENQNHNQNLRGGRRVVPQRLRGAGRGLKDEQINQAAVARQMSLYVNRTGAAPACVLSLGDNFYDDGVASIEDTLWTQAWSSVYLSFGPSLRVPWHPVFGNHDYGYGQTGLSAQIARTTATDDDQWQFPASNYSRVYHSSDGSVAVQLLCVDTTTLAPSENKATSSSGGVSEATQAARIADQLARLEAALNTTYLNLNDVSSGRSWVIVVGHYPVFSPGSHGDTVELNLYLQPLLERHGVDVYLCGHDHFSAHMSNAGIHYFVAGAGAMVDYAATETAAQDTHWVGEGFSAFASLRASRSRLSVSYINSTGHAVYNYTLRKNATNGTVAPTAHPTTRPTVAPSIGGDGSTVAPTAATAEDAVVRPEDKWVVAIASSVILALGAGSCFYGRYLYRSKNGSNGAAAAPRPTGTTNEETGSSAVAVIHPQSPRVSPSKPFYSRCGVTNTARRPRHRRLPIGEGSSRSTAGGTSVARPGHHSSRGCSDRTRYVRALNRSDEEEADGAFSVQTV